METIESAPMASAPSSKKGILTSLAVGAVFSAFVYFYLGRVQDPSGVNGYFYLKQIKTLSLFHSFYFKDYSLAFLLPAVISALGLTPLTAFRLSQAIVMGSFVALQGLLILQTLGDHAGRARWQQLALVIALCTFLNIPFYELGFSFYKNFTSLVFVLLTLKETQRHLQVGPLVGTKKFKSVARIVAPAVLAFFCHKSASLLLLVLGAVIWVQTPSKKNLALWIAVAIAVALGFFKFFSRGQAYLLHLTDSLVFSPGLLIAWLRELSKDKNTIYFGFGWALVMLVAYLPARKSLSASSRLLGDFITLLALITWAPIYQTGQENPAYRLMLVWSALALPMVAALLLAIDRRLSFSVGMIAGLVLAQWMVTRPLSVHFPSYWRLTSEVSRIKEFVRPEDHLICHHGMEFFVDYVTDLRCQIFVSENKTQKQYRLVYAPATSQWIKIRAFSTDKALVKVGTEYLLLKEQDWQEVSQSLRISSHWRNPVERRPAFVYPP